MDTLPAPALPSPLLGHLLSLRDRVLRRDARLFTRAEKLRLKALDGLPLDAAALLARLITRKEGWIRRSSLDYAECPRPEAALQLLAAQTWIERWPAQDGTPPPPGVLESLTHREIRHLLLEAGQVPSSRVEKDRQRLIRLLQSHEGGQHQMGLWEEAQGPMERLVALESWVRLEAGDRRLLRVVELCHFGRRGQGVEQLTLEALGLRRFVAVPLSRSGIFTQREDLEAVLDEGDRLEALLEALHLLSQELRGWRRGRPLPARVQRDSRLLLAEAWNLAAPLRQLTATPDADEGKRQLRQLRLKALRAGASLLERLGRRGAAAAWQRLALSRGVEGRRRGELWQRLVLNLRHSGREESAAEALRQALDEVLDPLARHELERCAGRSAVLLKAPSMGVALARHPGHHRGRVQVQDATGAVLTAEDAALRLLEREGWRGLHAENHLLCSLVGLCAWELIFQPIPGAFLHPMQGQPLDWGRPGFLDRRITGWRRLEELMRRNGHGASVRHRLEACAGLQNPLVAWWPLVEAPDADLWREGLILLLEEIPGPVLAEFTARLLEHPGACGHGLPDLLVWRALGNGRREWRLVEVKGPGDQLFTAQRLWHHWLLLHGLPVQLLRLDRETPPIP